HRTIAAIHTSVGTNHRNARWNGVRGDLTSTREAPQAQRCWDSGLATRHLRQIHSPPIAPSCAYLATENGTASPRRVGNLARRTFDFRALRRHHARMALPKVDLVSWFKRASMVPMGTRAFDRMLWR